MNWAYRGEARAKQLRLSDHDPITGLDCDQKPWKRPIHCSNQAPQDLQQAWDRCQGAKRHHFTLSATLSSITVIASLFLQEVFFPCPSSLLSQGLRNRVCHQCDSVIYSVQTPAAGESGAQSGKGQIVSQIMHAMNFHGEQGC